MQVYDAELQEKLANRKAIENSKKKVMTNLDSILQSRDITLPTKVCLVKAVAFPVVMYGSESWNHKES